MATPRPPLKFFMVPASEHQVIEEWLLEHQGCYDWQLALTNRLYTNIVETNNRLRNNTATDADTSQSQMYAELLLTHSPHDYLSALQGFVEMKPEELTEAAIQAPNHSRETSQDPASHDSLTTRVQSSNTQ